MPQTRTTVADVEEPETGQSRWYENTKMAIECLDDRPPGWEEPNPLPVDPAARRRAIAIVSEFAMREPELTTPSIAATTYGGVDIEWDNGTYCVAVDVDPEEGVTFYCEDSKRNIVREGPEPDKALLQELLTKFRP